MSGRIFRRSAPVLALLASNGCAHDRILPVVSVCGDGHVTTGEECDAPSPGCVECRVTPGFECRDDACSAVCGDGNVVGDEECDPPDDVTCDRSCKAATSDGCNIDGYFIVRQTSYSRDTIVGQVQTASNWYFYRFSQGGDDFATEEALTCGLVVSGTVDVSLDVGGNRALLHANEQGRAGAHGPRRGRFVKNGAACEFSFDKFYLARGVEERFLPDDFLNAPPKAELQPLPFEPTPLTPTREHLDGTTDADGDGLPGLGLHITGNLAGVRSVVHRDWCEYTPDPSTPVPVGAIEFVARSDFDGEENVLSVSGCAEGTCGLLLATSAPARDLPGHVVFRYLGKTLDDPRVAAFAGSAPGADEEQDLLTCERVRVALPHDGAVK